MAEIERKKEDNLDYIDDKFRVLTSSVQSKINYILGKNSSIQIENIGIYAASMAKQVCNFYKKNGVSLDEALTSDIVIYYFLYYKTVKADKVLSRYVDESKNRRLKLFTGIGSSSKLDIDSNCLKKYQKLKDEIFYFDLKRDIVSILESYLDNYPRKDEEYRRKVNTWINLYNLELSQLGISGRLGHRYFNESGQEKVLRKTKAYE